MPVSQILAIKEASRRPLPNRYGSGVDRFTDSDFKKTGLWQDLKSIGFEHMGEAIGTAYHLWKHKREGGYVDDKTMIMERAIRLSTWLPPLSKNRLALTAQQVDQLWGSLQHPPLSYLGNEFTYRQPDGGNNNILYPQLGRAGTPYARTIKPLTTQPGALPDPGLIFDSIFARRDGEYRKHPNNVSSMLYYTASIIIHDLFRTNRKDINISDTSSYLDLSPLYGCNAEEQATIRTFKDGKLKPDSFAEKRLLGFPPGVAAFLITFNRFHNYVVENLAAINERGRFSPRFERGEDRNDPAVKKKAEERRDEHLFQTGRLVTCGMYMNFILNDYLRTIVNLNRVDSTWTLDPRFDPNHVWNPDGTPAGVGNQVSVEFNLVYRWHSNISERDDLWTQDFLQNIFPGRDVTKLTLPEFIQGTSRWERSIPDDPAERTFAGLERNAQGKFEDEDLVRILCDSIEDCAGASGARNVPVAMRIIEILGIEQTRGWQCATLNEFREFFGLKAYNNFEEINKDPKVQDALRQLYDHPDYVELYPGIVAEDAKEPWVPGVGIGPTYTISRAILSDAVTLVRGDRFYTVDYTAANLTNWGFTEVASDPNVNYGCVGYKMFIKCYPNHFKYNSIYAHHPLTIPSENRKIQASLGKEDLFDYERPTFIPPRIPILGYNSLQTILRDSNNFKVPWGPMFDYLMQKDFMLSRDEKVNFEMKEFVGKCMYAQEAWKDEVVRFYEKNAVDMLRKKSYKMGNCYMVDAVRDISNLLHARFASELFALPLKTEENPKGIFTEQEMYMILCLMFVAIFFDVDSSKSFPLRHTALKTTRQLGDLMKIRVTALKRWGALRSLLVKEPKNISLKSYGTKMIQRLLESGKSAEDVTWSYIIPTAGASAPNQAIVFAQVLDFYLSDENKHHLKEIQRLAQDDSEEAYEKIKKYALEATRLAGTFGLYRKVACDNVTLEDMGRTLHLKKDDMVFISFITASRDPQVFPDPLTVRLDRPEDSYIQYGVGPHTCLGKNININTLTTLLRTFARLPGLRRAPGPQGQIKCIPMEGGFKRYMKEDWSGFWPFPTTMKICFDDLI